VSVLTDSCRMRLRSKTESFLFRRAPEV
jgi:hypothetical protein